MVLVEEKAQMQNQVLEELTVVTVVTVIMLVLRLMAELLTVQSPILMILDREVEQVMLVILVMEMGEVWLN
jgi:hypothetical protein